MGKKKDGLSKSERKALEQHEAQLIAELEARADKSRKKGKAKKSEKSEKSDRPDLTTLKRKALKTLIADKTNGDLRKRAKAELQRRDEAMAADEHAVKPKKAKAETADVEPVKPKRETSKATKALDVEETDAIDKALVAGDDETVDGIKARVKAKRARRELLASDDYKASIDRADEDAVRAYNDEAAELGLGFFLTSDAERARIAEAGVVDNSATPEKPKAKRAKAEREPDDFTPHEGKTEEELAAIEQVAEEVETETGTIYAVGTPDPVAERGFAIPSDVAPVDFETNGNGQYKVKRLDDGKLIGYTRVTTYIDTNEDKSRLTDWKMRVLLEGVAVNDTPTSERFDPVVARVRDLIHRRDVAIAKARKADRKGKLVVGQLVTLTDAAWSEFKRDLDKLASDLLDLGGAHEKAAKGTSLHALLEVYDREGIDAIGAMLEEGKITPADMADVEAYARALADAGIKIIPELIETPIVIDDLKVAGRLDRVVLARMPGSQRAARYVLDVKSGRIDYAAGKIAQQLELYSRGTPYDLETHERLEPHKASRTKALVLHLPAGSAQANIYPVDLSTGRYGNDLSGKVRAFRNDGRRAIDTKTDLTVANKES